MAMNTRSMLNRFVTGMIVVAAAGLWCGTARAQTNFYWTNTASSLSTWNTPANWTNGSPSQYGGTNVILNFRVAGTYTSSNDFAGIFTNNGLVFGAGIVTLAGGTNAFINNDVVMPVVTNYGATVTIKNPLILATNTTFDGASNTTVSGVISGSGGIVQAGSGTLTLSGGSNTYTGTTTVNGGILALARPNPYITIMGPLVVNANGTVRWDVMSAVIDTSTVTVNGGTLNLGSNNDYISTLSLNSGAQVQGDQSASQYIIVNGSVGAKILGTGGGNAGTISSRIAIASQYGVARNARTQEFDVASGTTLTVSGPIVNNATPSSAQVGSLRKSNSGTLVLSGTNTYTGATTVSNGVLLVHGLTTNSAITVVSGGTLGGTGKVGSVTVNTGGIITGNGTNTVGTLTTTNLTVSESAVIYWNYDETTNDVIKVATLGALPNVATVTVSQVTGSTRPQPLPAVLCTFEQGGPGVDTDLSGWVVTGGSDGTRVVVRGNQIQFRAFTGTLLQLY